MSNGNDKDSKPSGGEEVNPYIPKYISTVPWYRKVKDEKDNEGYLAHQRKHDEPSLTGMPEAGSGIKDEFVTKEGIRVKVAPDYDSVRDRWHGISAEELDYIYKSWSVAKERAYSDAENKDRDDIEQYELEMLELDLTPKDLHLHSKEDPMEKVLRDREDVPAYILNVTAGGKISSDNKSSVVSDARRGFVNNADDFVKQADTSADPRGSQTFAWEHTRPADDTTPSDTHLEHQNSHLPPNNSTTGVTSNTNTTASRSSLSKSACPEDIYTRGHTSVWGSFYSGGKWGYRCCGLLDIDADCPR
ncbi:Piso0_002762 [Millerozyma farinosa CBS 7064]|uniref:Pre-mRNA-splicing factor SLU7 n=1 Tax=Pichia sorbitophila (strain ATCC MYA-4447 / BCRC 22081 / CBS 7064 / NBRC 10061 / NRRL Y-12695) TaxID=559304 RepID=G8YDF8_PICSO|nr:Piso0_002762 [Millerozyma farinosa CBS 7064]